METKATLESVASVLTPGQTLMSGIFYWFKLLGPYACMHKTSYTKSNFRPGLSGAYSY